PHRPLVELVGGGGPYLPRAGGAPQQPARDLVIALHAVQRGEIVLNEQPEDEAVGHTATIEAVRQPGDGRQCRPALPGAVRPGLAPARAPVDEAPGSAVELSG